MTLIQSMSLVEELESTLAHLIARVAYMSSQKIIFEALSQDCASKALELTKEHQPYTFELYGKWFVIVPLKIL